MSIKRSAQPYFVLDGNVFALLAAKYHFDLFACKLDGRSYEH